MIALSWVRGWLRLEGMALLARLRGRPATIHVQAPETAAELVFLGGLRLTAGRLVVTAHNALPHDRPGLGRLIHWATYRLPHLIIAQTPAEAEVVRGLAGGGTKVGVVAHGTYGPIVDAFPNSLNGDGDDFRVAHLGSLRPYKGFDTVVAAFARALADDPTLRLRVVGRATDEAGVRRLLEQLPAEAVSADLRYLTIEELVGEVRSADVLLLGHRRASESGILHLALAAGTPVVGPDIAGIGRLLACQADWLYPAADAESAAAALAAVARGTRDDRTAIRAAAREIERSAPSWDAVAAAHLALLTEIDEPEGA